VHINLCNDTTDVQLKSPVNHSFANNMQDECGNTRYIYCKHISYRPAAFARTVAFQKIGDTERGTWCVMACYDVNACRKLLR